MSKRLHCLTLLLAAMLVFRGAAQAEDNDARLAREATQLFQAVLRDEAIHVSACMFPKKWNTEPVPESSARRYLGLRPHGDLVSAFHGKSEADILGAAGLPATAFCDDDAHSATIQTRLRGEMVGPGTDAAGAKARCLVDMRENFSFPIFDDGYHRAIIVLASDASSYRQGPDAKPVSIGANGSIGGLVYAKHAGLWRRVTTEGYAFFDGPGCR